MRHIRRYLLGVETYMSFSCGEEVLNCWANIDRITVGVIAGSASPAGASSSPTPSATDSGLVLLTVG